MNNQQILAAARRLQAQRGQMQVPRGAQYGAIAGLQPQQPQRAMQGMARQPARQPNPAAGGMRLSAAMQQKMAQMQGLAVPQGAQAGNLAGCGDGDCMDSPYAAPFNGFPPDPQPWNQWAAILPVRVDFGTELEATVSVSCGNSLFYGCGARSFNGPDEVNLDEVISGGTDVNLICSGGLDLNYFNTNGNGCYCEFDFSCFSSFFPLILGFSGIGSPSVVPPVNMAIVGSRLQGGNACAFWPGLMPGFGGMLPGVPTAA